MNTDELKPNQKIYIEHKSAILNERIKIFKGKKMITPKEIQSITDISRYLIIILPTRYINNILYYLSTYEISFIIILRKIRSEFC